MRHRLLVVLTLIACVALAAPVAAKISQVDPFDEPEIVLDPAEAARLAALQGTTFPSLYSEISPDDAVVFSVISSPSDTTVGFINVGSGAVTPVDPAIFNYEPLTEIVWRDAQTAVFISSDDGEPIVVSLNRDSGAVSAAPLPMPGFPISLAPNGSRVLVALLPSLTQSKSTGMKSPFTIEVRKAPLQRPGPARFDAEHKVLQLAEDEVLLASYDLNSGELIPLTTFPESSGFASQPSWTPDGSKVAWVRTTLANVGREGNRLAELTTQDGLGALPPEQNPFFQGNMIDAFDIARGEMRPAGIKAAGGDGSTFILASWNSDGKTLMALTQRPSVLTGRRYPIYQFPDRASIRFYNDQLQPIGSFDRAELQGPWSVFPQWVSPDEIIFDAAWGLSYRLFYYNRVSGEFRQVSIWDGTYYQVRATHQSRQLIYNYSAFPHPPELYRIGWDGTGLTALTGLNGAAVQANQIRSDLVSFTLANGAVRTGYLLQPAGAAFPPQNVPIVVWQQGGPGGTITNEWGGNVEMPYNLLPNFGMAVLVLPLPGREGYGPQFYNDLANGTNYGQIDIDENAQVVNQLIAGGWTSQGRVGITGCSYGGYFATQSITTYPDLFAAANTQCSLLDLLNEWQFGFTGFLSYLEGRTPTSDPAEYVKDSPIYNAEKIRTPTLIFAGTRDFLPYTISSNLHDQINANGVASDFLQFRNEGHGLALPNSQFAAAQAQINWFRQYLPR